MLTLWYTSCSLNDLVHGLLPGATVVAEGRLWYAHAVSPGPRRGVGFDYRLAMAVPDRWIEYLKDRTDDQWSMGEIAHTLTNRRYTEKCIAYAESHDQVRGKGTGGCVGLATLQTHGLRLRQLTTARHMRPIHIVVSSPLLHLGP